MDQLIYDLRSGFESALDDDLNIAAALAVIFEFMGKINNLLADGLIGKSNAQKALTALKSINEVVGIIEFDTQVTRSEIKKIKELIDKRNAARSVSNWAEADSIRDQLLALGVDVLDTPQGAIWHFK